MWGRGLGWISLWWRLVRCSMIWVGVSLMASGMGLWGVGWRGGWGCRWRW